MRCTGLGLDIDPEFTGFCVIFVVAVLVVHADFYRDITLCLRQDPDLYYLCTSRLNGDRFDSPGLKIIGEAECDKKRMRFSGIGNLDLHLMPGGEIQVQAAEADGEIRSCGL